MCSRIVRAEGEWCVAACWASSRMQKRGVWAVSEVDNMCAAAAPGGVVGFGGRGRRIEVRTHVEKPLIRMST